MRARRCDEPQHCSCVAVPFKPAPKKESPLKNGRSIAIYSDTGGGKTTQIGEYAKYRFKLDKGRTALFTSDLGGYDSIAPLVRLGVVQPVEVQQGQDVWLYINDASEGKGIEEDVKVVAYDSGTSMGEALLNYISKSDWQVGQQKTQRFQVNRASDPTRSLVIGTNNETHYGLVQNFLLDSIWRSTWLTRRGIDVIWTFSVYRGEEQDSTPILGPKLAGKALTAAIPKWFNYTFRLVSVPTSPGSPPRHLLYIQEQPEFNGMGHSFSNPRYPLAATSELPSVIEPASVSEAIMLIEKGQTEAEDALRLELGL